MKPHQFQKDSSRPTAPSTVVARKEHLTQRPAYSHVDWRPSNCYKRGWDGPFKFCELETAKTQNFQVLWTGPTHTHATIPFARTF